MPSRHVTKSDDPQDVGCKYGWLWGVSGEAKENKAQHEAKDGTGCPEYGGENVGMLDG